MCQKLTDRVKSSIINCDLMFPERGHCPVCDEWFNGRNEMTISSDATELPKNSLERWFVNNVGVAQFVEDVLEKLRDDPMLTIHIRLGRCVGYFVEIVTTVSLEDTSILDCSDEQQTI